MSDTVETVEEKDVVTTATVDTEKTNENNTETPDVIDWKKEARKWEDQSKANFEKAKKADLYETSEKPALNKRIAELELENNSIRLDTLKKSIAATYNLPESLIKRLTGSNAEELEADAQELSETFGNKAPTKPTVLPVKTQGQTGTEVKKGKISTPEELQAYLTSLSN